MIEEFYTVLEQIPRGRVLDGLLGVMSLSGIILLYKELKPKKSNVHIRQRFKTGAAIRQPNRIDIDLFLFAQNTKELTARLEYCYISGDIKFSGPDGATTAAPSELGSEKSTISRHPRGEDHSLSSGDGFPVTLRFSFPQDGRLSELLYQYDEMEVPWGVRVADGKREYPVTGTAVVKCRSGGAHFPHPKSVK